MDVAWNFLWFKNNCLGTGTPPPPLLCLSLAQCKRHAWLHTQAATPVLRPHNIHVSLHEAFAICDVGTKTTARGQEAQAA